MSQDLGRLQMRIDGKNVTRYLYCLSVLEETVSHLYRSLSKKVKHPYLKFSLLYLAYSSQKNSEILKGMGHSIAELKVNPKDYRKMLGTVWELIKQFSREISSKKELNDKELSSLANRLGAVYSITLVQFKTLNFMAKQISETYKVRLVDMKETLELLVKDEETNGELLEKIRAFYTKEEDKNLKANTPIVKYQNPDKWYRQPPPGFNSMKG